MLRRRSTSPSAVGQEIFDDVVAVGLEQHAGAAMLADLPVGPLDHAVALARHGGFHPSAGCDLEALFSARLGLDLGHFALLWCGFGRKALRPVPPDKLKTSVLMKSASPPRQPFRPGGERPGLWQRRPENTTARPRTGSGGAALLGAAL